MTHELFGRDNFITGYIVGFVVGLLFGIFASWRLHVSDAREARDADA